MLAEVDTGTRDIARLRALLDEGDAAALRADEQRARDRLAGRTIWNVNSTARGGGVAEMLYPLVAYGRGIGVDVRWGVIGGSGDFFHVTKRIHNRLHGSAGDWGPLGDAERAIYDATLAPYAGELVERIGAGGLAILHDPQVAGLVTPLRMAGIPVVWRCHVGVNVPNDWVRTAWDFLRPYVEQASRVVFSRRQFVWEGLDAQRSAIIAPSIDPFAPKNQALAAGAADAILAAAGMRTGGARGVPEFERLDGARGVVGRRAQVDEDRPLRPADDYVLQVSRWDALKDPLGVIAGFAEHVAPAGDAHLVYAGPDVTAVADDPEGATVLARARELRAGLPPAVRARVHLALLPMDDLEENAAVVNALQTGAAVVVQKSLAEGFGLTVAEAMWKERPVVASRVGGIEDQIEDGVSGLLVDDPTDLAAYGAAVRALLADGGRARAIGSAARKRVAQRFLGSRSLMQYLDLVEPLVRPEMEIA